MMPTYFMIANTLKWLLYKLKAIANELFCTDSMLNFFAIHIIGIGRKMHRNYCGHSASFV